MKHDKAEEHKIEVPEGWNLLFDPVTKTVPTGRVSPPLYAFATWIDTAGVTHMGVTARLTKPKISRPGVTATEVVFIAGADRGPIHAQMSHEVLAWHVENENWPDEKVMTHQIDLLKSRRALLRQQENKLHTNSNLSE